MLNELHAGNQGVGLRFLNLVCFLLDLHVPLASMLQLSESAKRHLSTDSYMAMGTLCTAKKRLIYGDGDALHCQKEPNIWRWGHFALPKNPSYMAMGTLCTAKKPLIYGDGDTLHCLRAPHIWRWGHFALPKSPSYMAMGTLCAAKKPLIYGDGDTLHCQKAPHIWRWGHFAMPKSPSYMAMGTLCTAKVPLIYGDPYMRGFLAVQSVPIAIYEGLFGSAKCPHRPI